MKTIFNWFIPEVILPIVNKDYGKPLLQDPTMSQPGCGLLPLLTWKLEFSGFQLGCIS